MCKIHNIADNNNEAMHIQTREGRGRGNKVRRCAKEKQYKVESPKIGKL